MSGQELELHPGPRRDQRKPGEREQQSGSLGDAVNREHLDESDEGEDGEGRREIGEREHDESRAERRDDGEGGFEAREQAYRRRDQRQ
jgi:hypothetical protein